MAYIDYDFYAGVCSTPVEPDEFEILAMRASEFIDLLTFNKIGDISRLPQDVREKVKKAAAYYVEQFLRQGGIDALTGFSESLSGVSVRLGNTSVSGVSQGESIKSGKSSVSHVGGIVRNMLADSLLASAGLMHRGVGA